ncbi:MAG TPA: hypothetical protein DCX77_09365 [Acidimicrobiaceae bacterium]|nr:hypothetical protein [Acidimicrobiaceae bacterium]
MESHIEIQKINAQVTVSIAGTTLAQSSSTLLLLEGNLPPRHYFPREDVNMDFLVPSESITHCPHKGDAQYWSFKAGNDYLEDVVWCYETPIEQMSSIGGLLCFYNERVDLDTKG